MKCVVQFQMWSGSILLCFQESTAELGMCSVEEHISAVVGTDQEKNGDGGKENK